MLMAMLQCSVFLPVLVVLVMATTISIVHFNDVYNIQERDTEPVGGAPRFVILFTKHTLFQLSSAHFDGRSVESSINQIR